MGESAKTCHAESSPRFLLPQESESHLLQSTCQISGSGMTSTAPTFSPTSETSTSHSTVVPAGLMPPLPLSPIELRSLELVLGQMSTSPFRLLSLVSSQTLDATVVMPT